MPFLPLLEWSRRLIAGEGAETSSENPRHPNVLIILFDALSAQNVSLYDYPRQTTPNFERFAQRATVFHKHYAGGGFTSPGTASLLTGTYPWTHRAFHLYGTVADEYQDHNLFHQFPSGRYTKMTYTHNDLVATLLDQFAEDIDVFKTVGELALFYENIFSDRLFSHDYKSALLGETIVTRGQRGQDLQVPSSSFFSILHRIWRTGAKNDLQAKYAELFPRGLPASNASRVVYFLEDAIDWVRSQVANSNSPILGYFHFLPPHEPYHTRHEFVDRFLDGWEPIPKPAHFFSQGLTQETLNQYRQEYDEYIAYADAEFGRFYDFMEETGQLENTLLVLTSDHGEMFERGILEHITPTMYEPLIRVPLVISRPGQRQRLDVDTPTSCVDLLPTLLHHVGLPIPEWCEGEVLPTFGEEKSPPGRAIFAVEAKTNPKMGPLAKGTIAMIENDHKLIHYFGYPGHESVYELYDLANDPEELIDLYSSKQSLALEMSEKLQAKLLEVNQKYAR